MSKMMKLCKRNKNNDINSSNVTPLLPKYGFNEFEPSSNLLESRKHSPTSNIKNSHVEESLRPSLNMKSK